MRASLHKVGDQVFRIATLSLVAGFVQAIEHHNAPTCPQTALEQLGRQGLPNPLGQKRIEEFKHSPGRRSIEPGELTAIMIAQIAQHPGQSHIHRQQPILRMQIKLLACQQAVLIQVILGQQQRPEEQGSGFAAASIAHQK